ncbi:unnamed protein product [Periconia digitata]|uniref:PPM-type phosphatase domain-containing protein n=1 Tax=Periconia digitata TaxID=1303443 RepID=A0A9W4UPK7_9PLEO|nr:unnamed protein product [Periconia digitata]
MVCAFWPILDQKASSFYTLDISTTTPKMMSSRWQAAVRQLQGQPSAISRALMGTRHPNLRPRTATSRLHHSVSGRVQLESRASALTQCRYFSSRSRLSAGKNDNKTWTSSPVVPTQVLESRFPKKTVLFFAILGTAAYFLLEVVEPDWTDNAMAGFDDQPHSVPLQFYRDRESLDNRLEQFYIGAFELLKDPERLMQINDLFNDIANGWMMNEENAQEWYIPVTHGCRFKSNEPCDFYCIGTAPGPGSKPWNYWSVFDGHAGKATAFYLQNTMHPELSRHLSDLPPNAASWSIHDSMKAVFIGLDKEIMDRARHAVNWYPAANSAAMNALAPAFHGSCALVAAFDPEQSKLHVACTGDSRAVLGRWDDVEGKYIAQPLSVDQTGFNPSEVARITSEHPDEPSILDPKTGRLLGLAVTRAFGDHRWKWDNNATKTAQHKFWGPAPRPNSTTPPYLTAEPEITETDIVRVHPNSPSGKSDFMIIATDGLWDHMSSSTAVSCVSSWLTARARSPDHRVSTDPNRPYADFSNPTRPDPGVTFSVEDGQEVTWQAEPRYFAIEDDNAAVCLTRNAMGGLRRGLVAGLVTMGLPARRNAVDDTTVMVVFFDQLDTQGGKEKEGGEQIKRRWWFW